MSSKLIRYLLTLMLIGIAAPGSASEITHIAYTWLCEDERQAHGRCMTSHANCGTDCSSLDFACDVVRNSSVLGKQEMVIPAVGSHGVFQSQTLDVPLYGSGTVSYCTRNRSKYRNWLNTIVIGQGVGTYCRVYSSTGSGGEEP